jgi:hypothetical protein
MKLIKNIVIALSLLLGLIVSSCVEDRGNYEYKDPNLILPVTVVGLSDTSVMKGLNLVLNPEVTIAGDESKYSYSWYVTPTITAGALPTKTVLADTKNLNIPVTLAAGNYFLSYTITDIARDIYLRTQITLTVKATDVSTGWFVLKDIDNKTDFDYIDKNGILYPDVLLTQANPVNSRLTGTAVKIEYQGGRYYHQITDEEGKATILSNQTVYHILSSEDIKVFNSKDLTLFKNREDIFYTPTDCYPNNIKYTMTDDLYLINDHKMSTVYGMVPHIGKIPAPKAGFYTLHDDLMTNYSNGLGFDLDSRTFYLFDAYDPSLTPFASPSQEVGVSTTNMDATALNILTATESMTSTGFAVMKNVNKEEYYIATVRFNGTNSYPFTAFDTIPSGSKFPNAPVKAAPYSGNFVYFAEGNKLSAYRNASGLSPADRETLLREFPAGETVSYMTNVYVANSFNYLAVLTNSANGWKLYAFNIIGLGNPEFESTPALTYQGEGNARYLMHRQN